MTLHSIFPSLNIAYKDKVKSTNNKLHFSSYCKQKHTRLLCKQMQTMREISPLRHNRKKGRKNELYSTLDGASNAQSVLIV